MTKSEVLLDKVLGLTDEDGNGWPDRGVLVDGRLVVFEYKGGKDKLRPEQLKRLTQVVRGGGKAYVVRIQEVDATGHLCPPKLRDSAIAVASGRTSRRLSDELKREIMVRLQNGDARRKIVRELGVGEGTVSFYSKKLKAGKEKLPLALSSGIEEL